MSLAVFKRKATLLSSLGELRRSGSLADSQFEMLRELALNEDSNMSANGLEALSTIEKLWSYRRAGFLKDDQYQHQIREVFQKNLGVEAPHESGEGPNEIHPQASQQTAASSTIMAGSDDAHGGAQETGGAHNEVIDDDGDDAVSEGDTGEEEAGTAGDDVVRDLSFLRRWKKTDTVSVRGRYFSEDNATLVFIDSTAALLRQAKEKRFPRLSQSEAYGTPDMQRYRRQGPVYRTLKKVIVFEKEDGHMVVFRATPAEIKKEVAVVSDGKLSAKDYLKKVIELREDKM